MIGSPVSVPVFETNDPIRHPAEPAFGKARGIFLIDLEPVLYRDSLEVIADQLVGTTKIRNAQPESVCLGDEKTPLRIEPETPGILDKRESDPGVPFEFIVLDQAAE